MTKGSALHSPLTAATAVVLLGSFINSAEARTCGYDIYGRYRCRGLLTGTVAGIVLAAVIPALFLLIMLLYCCTRRRRRRAQNAAYANDASYGQQYAHQQQGSNPMYQTGQGYYAQPSGYGQQSQGPQGGSYYGQQGSSNPYAPNSSEFREWQQANGGGNQQQYAPPNSPPPAPEYTPKPTNSENNYAPPPGPPPQAAGQTGQASKFYNPTNRAGEGSV